MMQNGAVILGAATVQIELPAADKEVIPGVLWGAIEAFPTPAYWAYQVLARRAQGTRINYRLGSTLREEVGACLLGGHGIPASVGLAAFEALRAKGAFTGEVHEESTLFDWLSKPMQVGDRTIRYRFARQKAKYLAAAMAKMNSETPPITSGRQLRDWLIAIPGIGFKTASWVARNWLDADDVAILDIHLLRAGLLARFFPDDLTVERHYLQLESMFLDFSAGLGVRPSELDAVIWWEMMSSVETVNQIFEGLRLDTVPRYVSNRRRANKRNTDTADQLALI
jgi:thermostable 8-oxoguanine DNA glycosylase